ncbi:MAG: hypothetical protein AB7N80_12305, partial [Bdellovibrionales bacterium]
MKFNDEQLSEFSKEHLCYEIDSLYSALELFAKQPKIEIKDVTDALNSSAKNLFLEGIILHGRCLFEFLYFKESPNPKKADDALAIHYFDEPSTWEALRPNNSGKLNSLWDRANKEVAHLTYARMNITQLAKQWDLYTITNDMLTTLLLFAKNANPKKLHPNVALTLEFWKKRTEYEPG